MKVIFDREYLLKKVNRLKAITKLKSLMPILRNVLIRIDNPPGGEIIATDLDISAIAAIDSMKNEEGIIGRICMPGGILAEILEGLHEKDILFSMNETGKQLVIRSNEFKAGIALADPDEFPDVFPLNEDGDDIKTFSIANKDLMRGVTKTLYAVSADESRIILTGLLIQVKDGKLIMCATDGFRLAFWKKGLPGEPSDTPQIVIPGRNVKILKEIIGDTDRISIIIKENKVQFKTESVTVIFRTLEVAYPDYENIIIPAGNAAFMKRSDLLDAIRRVRSVAKRDDALYLQRSHGGLSISTEGEAGYAKDLVECKYQNKTPLNFAFNMKFILDALEHLEADKICMQYPKEYYAVQFYDEKGYGEGAIGNPNEDYICVVMPIRVETPPLLKKAEEEEKK
jgi:DNA polymerase-3 subunit beta